jgi:iron-siderophore transport system permease protein
VRPLAAGIVVLVLVALASLAIGTKGIPLGDVVGALLHDDGSDAAAIVRDVRLPRLLMGLAVGIALGLAGALMQALTRNPLADPGLLGINAGAAAAIVVAIAALHLNSPEEYVWFAFVGAAAASVIVYVLGSHGRAGATPVRLALAGTAVAAALTAFTNGITLLDPLAFNDFRFWEVGALAGRELSVLTAVGPFLLVGGVITLVLARPLNALALGDDAGRALGAAVGRTRALGALAVTLLCGGATAIAGPIAFVGLTVPHAARAIAGTDQRRVLAYSAVLAPILLICADVIGRVVVRPSELEVGIVTALIGAPVFIALVRHRRIAQL